MCHMTVLVHEPPMTRGVHFSQRRNESKASLWRWAVEMSTSGVEID